MSVVYWEKQGNDLLCGVHCLNSLLQGPFFNEVDLAYFAQELDKQEKLLLEQAGQESKDFLEFVAGDSHNVEDGGNYSIQVLERALKKYNLKCKNVNANELIDKDLSNQNGFICHKSLHWYAIRKVDGVWYDLNSLYKSGPRHISDFYLSALLVQFQEQGQNIFLVSGDYPNNQKVLDNAEFEKHQLLVLNEDIQPYKSVKKGNNQNNKKKDSQMDEEWEDFIDIQDYDQKKQYNLRNKNQNKQVNQSDYQYDDIKQYQKQFDEMSQKKKQYENQQSKMVDEKNENTSLGFYQRIQLINRNNKKKQIDQNIDNKQSIQNSFYKRLSKQHNQSNQFIEQNKQDKTSDRDSRQVDMEKNNKDIIQNNQNLMDDLIEIQQEQIALTIWIDSQIRYTENFHLFDTIEDIHSFVKQKQRDLSQKKFILYTNVPDKMFFNNKEKFISDYGLYSGQILHIKLV
ncbi:hypothetical protein ABPG74_013815 [Tetrahymena malaccensis]